MDFSKKFSQKQLVNYSHIKCLIKVAVADDTVEKVETYTIKIISNNLGLSNDEFNWIVENAGFLNIVPPESEDEKRWFLMQYLILALGDGDFAEDEAGSVLAIADIFNCEKGGGDTVMHLIINLRSAKERAGSGFLGIALGAEINKEFIY